MMEYVLIGLLISIGWHIGKVLGHIMDEVAFTNIHKINWYKKLVDSNARPKQPRQNQSKPYKGTTMGFTKTREL